MSCNFCGNKTVISKTVDYIYRHSEKMLLIKNVPCEECNYCGERYFESKILKKIENTFFEIIGEKKKPATKIEVPVEDYALV